MFRKAAAAMLLLVASILAGCGSNEAPADGKISVITSFYPLYDFTQQIGGEHVEVANMIPAGVDPHDWTYRSQDIVNMTKARLFIYNGAGFDDWWVDDLLASMGDQQPEVIMASEGIELLPAQASEHESSDTDHHHSDHDHHHGDVDPHVWLSPLNAIQMAANIKDGLIAVDPDHQADYEANYQALKAELQQLHQEYSEAIQQAERRHFVTSHQAFAYMAHDYGLIQLSIMGLSTEAEPTSQDMRQISDFIREYGIRYILFEELASPKIAETLANDLGIGILPLHPIEGLTKQQEAEGADYIQLMRDNLQSLKLALQE